MALPASPSVPGRERKAGSVGSSVASSGSNGSRMAGCSTLPVPDTCWDACRALTRLGRKEGDYK
eukprot:298679-Prorocentrum_lima.AAC.1